MVRKEGCASKEIIWEILEVTLQKLQPRWL